MPVNRPMSSWPAASCLPDQSTVKWKNRVVAWGGPGGVGVVDRCATPLPCGDGVGPGRAGAAGRAASGVTVIAVLSDRWWSQVRQGAEPLAFQQKVGAQPVFDALVEQVGHRGQVRCRGRPAR